MLSGLLDKVLGPFVQGINSETLSISLWNGEVTLRNLELRPEALEGFGLPVHVLGAYIGELHLRVPWRSLGSQSITVSIDRIFVLVGPAATGAYDAEEEAKQEATAKEAELAAWEALQDQAAKQHSGANAVERLLVSLIQKIEISISNVHARVLERAVPTPPPPKSGDKGSGADDAADPSPPASPRAGGAAARAAAARRQPTMYAGLVLRSVRLGSPPADARAAW